MRHRGGTRDCIAELAGVTADLRKEADERTFPVPDPDDLVPLFRAHRRAVKAAEAAMRDEFGLQRLLSRFSDRPPEASPVVAGRTSTRDGGPSAAGLGQASGRS